MSIYDGYDTNELICQLMMVSITAKKLAQNLCRAENKKKSEKEKSNMED